MEIIRNHTHTVSVGEIKIGSNFPVSIQSMTDTKTNDVKGTIAQCERLIAAGCQLIRITAPAVRDVEYIKQIRRNLREKGHKTPIIVDVHFSPKVAEEAAKVVEKVRINPGNFFDKRAVFQEEKYTDEAYKAELAKLDEQFVKLLRICKENGTALRIGCNHGSLSDRILTRYGNTPSGMVESTMEFLRIADRERFQNIVISMKASNPLVMINAYRLLVSTMKDANMDYPIHLGVTESGEGEEGRLKSTIGIGTLLKEGIGDTIRVSLTESPETEIHFGKKLLNYIDNPASLDLSVDNKHVTLTYDEPDQDLFIIAVGMTLGEKLLNKTYDEVVLKNKYCDLTWLEELKDILLQVTRRKITRAEFISCPGCGRTNFNLQEVTKKVKKELVALKGLRIAVMGCIVNGPGEMDDADYGYVGAGREKITLYRGHTPVKVGIPQEHAIEELKKLIREDKSLTNEQIP